MGKKERKSVSSLKRESTAEEPEMERTTSDTENQNL